MYKFVIVSPLQTHGGSIVLHSLCKYLNDMGYKAEIFPIINSGKKKYSNIRLWKKLIRFHFYNYIKLLLIKIFGEMNLFRKLKSFKGYIDIPIKNFSYKKTPYIDDDTIVIYPELAYGNMLKAKNVVRWFLYYNRFPGDEKAYGKDDLFFAYRDVFNDISLNPDNKILNTPYFDLELYKRTNYGERHGTCYIIRKGVERSDLPKSFDGIIIDDLPEKEKVKVFNKSEYCISYDMQTAYSQIAAICGCISIVIPEEGKSLKDYYSENDDLSGVAFGMSKEEINRAISTAKLVKDNYEKANNIGYSSTENFVKICNNYFGG